MIVKIDGWIKKKIKDICSIGRGRVISAQEIEKNQGHYPVYSSQSKNKGELGRLNTYDFEGDYVTWTTDGAYAGTVFYRTGKFNCTNVCGTLKAKDNTIYMQFLAYKLSTQAKKHVSYVGNPKLMNNVIADIELSIPKDLQEQNQIATILSTIDKAIEQTEAIIAKQQRIKTGLMQDLLTRGIDKKGNIRSEDTHEFKDSPLGRIPVEWEISPAHNLCEAIIDCKNRTPPLIKGGHPVIRTPNVRDGEFVYQDLNTTDSNSYKIWTARGKPRVGDVLITREAPYGEACMIPEDIKEACLGQRMMIYQTDKKMIRKDFLVYAIYSEKVQTRLLELAGGSTVGHIRVGDIRSLLIPHPISIREQKNISKILNGISQTNKKLKKELNKLRRTKTGLMQDLLTGKVRVTSLKMSSSHAPEAVKIF